MDLDFFSFCLLVEDRIFAWPFSYDGCAPVDLVSRRLRSFQLLDILKTVNFKHFNLKI